MRMSRSLPISWMIRSGTSDAGGIAGDRRQPLGRLGHGGRGLGGSTSSPAAADAPGREVGGDLVVRAGLDDERDMGIGPAAGDALGLAEDGQAGEEHEQDRQQGRERIAAGHARGDRASGATEPARRAAGSARR